MIKVQAKAVVSVTGAEGIDLRAPKEECQTDLRNSLTVMSKGEGSVRDDCCVC